MGITGVLVSLSAISYLLIFLYINASGSPIGPVFILPDPLFQSSDSFPDTTQRIPLLPYQSIH